MGGQPLATSSGRKWTDKDSDGVLLWDKSHTNVNSEAEVITIVMVTGGQGPGGRHLATLVDEDLRHGPPVNT